MMKTVPHLYIYSNHPNIYNDCLFTHLDARDDFKSSFVFLRRVKISHPWKSPMANTYCARYIPVGWRGLLHAFKVAIRAKYNEVFIIAGWQHPVYLILAIILSLRQRKFALWTDTPNYLKKRSALVKLFRATLLRYIWHRSSAIFVTGNVGIDAATILKMPENRLINLPWVTDTDLFHPTPSWSLNPNRIRFVSCGRIDFSHKGQDVAIRALGRLHREGLRNFEYHIAGTGQDEVALLGIISEEGLSKCVYLRGWLEPNELPAFYHFGDVLLHTSGFDPYPNAVLEAMACGLTVVGSDLAGSVRDRVIDGHNGFIHRAGDIEGCAEKIKVFLQQPEIIPVFRQRSREIAEQWGIAYHLEIFEQFVHGYNPNKCTK